MDKESSGEHHRVRPITIIDLPVEVIALIMSYLPLADSIIASSCCKKWYYEDSRLWHSLADSVVVVDKLRVVQDLCPDEGVIPAWRPPHHLRNFIFKDVQVDFDRLMKRFCLIYGPQIRGLTFSECQISEQAFTNILTRCASLRFLSIDKCRQDAEDALFIRSGGIKFQGQNSLILENLTELNLACGSYLTDRVLNQLLVMAPNLSYLSLDFTGYFQGDTPKLRKSDSQSSSTLNYQGLIPLNVAADTFTFQNLSNILSIIQLKRLNLVLVIPLYNQTLSTFYFERWCEVLEGHCLQSLTVNTVGGMLSMKRIADTFEHSLQELNLITCKFERSDLLNNLGRLTELRRFTIKFCSLFDNPAAILELRGMKKLKYLEINILGNGAPAFLEVLSGLKDLKHLNIELVNWSLKNCFELVKVLPPLESLEFLSTSKMLFSAIEYVVAAIIFTQHKTIKSFCIGRGVCIKGYGLTGLLTAETMEALEFGVEDEAELEAIAQAKESLELIKSMPKFNDKNYLEIGKSSALTSLNFCNGVTLTDQGLENVFNLHRQLQYLALSEVPKITDSTLKLICQHCPQLEHLKLTNCKQITDIGVGYLGQLRRLRELVLTLNCNITDASLESLMMAKSQLRRVELKSGSESCCTKNGIKKFQDWLER